MTDKPAPDRRERLDSLKQKAEQRWKHRAGLNYEDTLYLLADITALEGLLRRAYKLVNRAELDHDDDLMRMTLASDIEAAGVLEDSHATN